MIWNNNVIFVSGKEHSAKKDRNIQNLIEIFLSCYINYEKLIVIFVIIVFNQIIYRISKIVCNSERSERLKVPIA